MPPLLQALAAFGAIVAGVVSYFLGMRHGRRDEPPIAEEHDDLKLRLAIVELEAKLATVMTAMREGVLNEVRISAKEVLTKVEEIESRVRSLEMHRRN